MPLSNVNICSFSQCVFIHK